LTAANQKANHKPTLQLIAAAVKLADCKSGHQMNARQTKGKPFSDKIIRKKDYYVETFQRTLLKYFLRRFGQLFLEKIKVTFTRVERYVVSVYRTT
jgi:hypothetical protein